MWPIHSAPSCCTWCLNLVSLALLLEWERWEVRLVRLSSVAQRKPAFALSFRADTSEIVDRRGFVSFSYSKMIFNSHQFATMPESNFFSGTNYFRDHFVIFKYEYVETFSGFSTFHTFFFFYYSWWMFVPSMNSESWLESLKHLPESLTRPRSDVQMRLWIRIKTWNEKWSSSWGIVLLTPEKNDFFSWKGSHRFNEWM